MFANVSSLPKMKYDFTEFAIGIVQMAIRDEKMPFDARASFQPNMYKQSYVIFLLPQE